MSDTIQAELTSFVCQLAWVFDEKTRLTDEFVGAARSNFAVAVTIGVIGRSIVFFVVLDLFDDQLFLQDDIQRGFDIIVVVFLFGLFLVGFCGLLGSDGRNGDLFVLFVVGYESIVVSAFSIVVSEKGLIVIRKFFAVTIRFGFLFEFFIFEIVSH
jgi:hypothetical protein